VRADRHSATAWLLGLWLCSQELQARADSQVYARVVVDTATVRAGPSVTYRRVYSAHRDEVFPVRARAATAYWFQIELPDATLGFISGEVVYNHELADAEAHGGRFLPRLFAPPPLPGARGEVALSGGVLGSGGLIALRPSFLLAPGFGIELTAAAAVAPGGRLFLAMIGPIVNLFPSSPLTPFFDLAGGFVASRPNADTFLLRSGQISGLSAGAGLRIGFRYRITLRLEARSYVFFETDRYVREEELSAGLTVFF
jgi:hypothetical protein